MECGHWAHQAICQLAAWMSTSLPLPSLTLLSCLKFFFIVMPDADALGLSKALPHWVTQ